jgi:nicotinamidase-related amidase
MLDVNNTALIIVDIQGNLSQAMYQKESLFENLHKIIRGAQVLGIPIVLTEQNPEKLGKTRSEIADLLPGISGLPKLAFSCCGDPGFVKELKKLDRRQVLIAGIETHVCVYQTALDLIASGFEAQVISDAVSSRTPENKDVGMQRMRDEGVKLSSAEMVLFELLRVAEGPKFKEILKIVK